MKVDPMNPPYARMDWLRKEHYRRYVLYVNSFARTLWCQECRGAGGETVPILDDGSGPFESCGWCEGTGKVTPWIRGMWLRWKRGLAA